MKVKPIDLLKKTFAAWSRDNGLRLAAALAYYSVFSIAPLLLIAIALAGAFFGRDAARGRIAHELAGLLGTQVAQSIQGMIDSARRPGRGLWASLIGAAILLFGASGVMGELKSALNTIWGVPAAQISGFWGTVRQRLLSFTMVLAVGFLLLVSLVISATLAAIGSFFQGWLPAPEGVLHLIHAVVSFGVTTGLFMLIFRYVPDADIAWRDVWLGGVATALLFIVGEYGIGLYLGKGSFTSAYGAAGSLVVLLVWVYYSAQILFFGAELTHVYAHDVSPRHRGRDQSLRTTMESERPSATTR
jgi:membrane protein